MPLSHVPDPVVVVGWDLITAVKQTPTGRREKDETLTLHVTPISHGRSGVPAGTAVARKNVLKSRHRCVFENPPWHITEQTASKWLCVSRVFHPYILVPRFPLARFSTLAFSVPALSAPPSICAD